MGPGPGELLFNPGLLTADATADDVGPRWLLSALLTWQVSGRSSPTPTTADKLPG
jgi:hypothetical protein